MTSYDTLADVYEWLVPDQLLEPEGSAAAFDAVLSGLRAGARVLDCAAGTGQLAVGMALRGFSVVATDASGGMIGRTTNLAAQRGVTVAASVCRWEDLPRRSWRAAFDAVFCVGNSLAHAGGPAARRSALAGMAQVLRPGGRLVITSRNWERLREQRPHLDVADRVVQRAGGRGLVIYAWTLPAGWDEVHHVDVAVAVLGRADHVTTRGERLSYWPFPHEDLTEDLHAAGLQQLASTYRPDTDRYLVQAERPS